MSARSNHGPKTHMLEPIPIPVSRFPEVNKTTRPAASRACPRRKPKAVRGTDLQLVLFAAGRNRPKSEKAGSVMNTDNNNVIPFRPLRIPSFSNDPINTGKRRQFEQHGREAFDQRPQAELRHHRYKFVEHGSLTKQRMSALF